MNPDFTTSVNIDFVFERTQRLKIEVRDADNESGTVSELVGTCEFEMGNLMGNRNNMIFIDLMRSGKKRGKCVVRSEKKSKVIDNISLQLSGMNMTNFGIFSSIVPVLILWKPIMPPDLAAQYHNNPDYLDEIPLKSCQWIKVWQSPAMRGKQCVFPLATFDSSKLCSGNMNFPVKVSHHLNFEN